ncbi:MAG: hypothetical protein J6B06_06790 [Lachnospiraceae bacterium]|nr:hypothetical protein [Lachnospiraceae bacterium]
MKELRTDKKFCALFSGILIIFFIAGMLKPDTGFSEFENRYLSSRPKLTMEAVRDGSYMKDYEEYVTDQFPLRNYWITLKTLTERAMLKSEINGVYFAEDHYYIEKQDKDKLFSELAMKNYQTLLDFAEKYTQKLGAGSVSVMLVPTASCVLRDKLPLLAPDDGQNLLLDELREKMVAGAWVDVYGELAAHSGEEIYYRTDHHWTTLGAFYGYCAWKEKQGQLRPDIADYDRVCLTDSFTGTLYARVNVEMKPDSIYAFVKPQEKLRMRLDMEGEWWDTIYSEEKLSTRDKYAVFCDGNHGVTEIETSLDNDRHLLIIKDSYAHCLAPFFTADFEKITMLDLRYYNGSVEEYVQQNQVTDVLTVYNAAGFSADRYINKFIK